MKTKQNILSLHEACIGDIEQVGGKNASLGEMLQNLSSLQINVPEGFIITVNAWNEFLDYNDLRNFILSSLKNLDADDLRSLQHCGEVIRRSVSSAEFPPSMIREISSAYNALSAEYQMTEADVAVRSSATAEDLPDASFAGQQDTYLNVSGLSNVLAAVRNCFASLFTDRAISYRHNFGYDHFAVGLAVCVQKMVRSDLACSGVAFSLDPESGFNKVVVINGSYGLGELIVQGAVSPDEYIVFKSSLEKGLDAIIEKKMGVKDKKLGYSSNPEKRVQVNAVPVEDQSRFCLSDQMALQLARWVLNIEEHYSALRGSYCPMDVEWALDGQTGQLFIVQARPETVHSVKKNQTVTGYSIKDKSREEKILLKGIAVGDKIASGTVHVLTGEAARSIASSDFRPGDILVAEMTDPDWEPIMKKASAIVTNKGGRTCHAAIVARELGVPAIVGCCGNATQLLYDKQTITVSCAEGETGFVYEGFIPFEKQEFSLSGLPVTEIPVMLNIASPALAFQLSHYPAKGVGLAREEFIINNYIRAHPLALLRHQEIADPALSGYIANLIRGYHSGEDYFIEKLSYGIGRIAAAFYPQPVIVRFSDFKSNEYYNLPGGEHFEPREENPMIGWRGASRYYSAEYREAFGLECAAVKKVREKMGLDNVIVMIPFCRTVGELRKVYDTMAAYGLKRGDAGLKVYLMAELPSNVIMAEEFAKHIDGFSIGSNDLTQLVLGLDRDSSLVAHIYDERNEAVRDMIRMLIQTAKKAGVKIGICGQGPSDFPDFARFLIEEGIDSISITPDSFFRTVHTVYEAEQDGLMKDKPVGRPSGNVMGEDRFRNAG